MNDKTREGESKGKLCENGKTFFGDCVVNRLLWIDWKDINRMPLVDKLDQFVKDERFSFLMAPAA